MATGLQIEGGGIQGLPTILKDWISWQAATPEIWSGGGDTSPAFRTQAARDAGYGFNENFGLMDSPFYRNTDNYEWAFDPQTGAPTLRVKSADKIGTSVKYVQDAAGNWVPDYNSAQAGSWDTNNNDDFYKGLALVFGSALGGNAAAAGGLLGSGAQGAWQAGMAGATPGALGATGGITTSALPAGEFSVLPGAVTESTMASGAGAFPGAAGGGAWGITDPALASLPAGQSWAGAVPNFTSAAQLAPYMGAGVPAATATPSGGGGGTGLKLPTNPADLLKTISQGAGMVGAVTGGGGGSSANTGSNTGGLIGAGLGGLLGYLDAKSQPDSLTIKNEIDPRLANLWYGADGAGGLTGEANSVYQQQKGQPNPLTQAGQQISSMANQTPDWAGLVNQNKALFDTNPYVEGILKKTQEGITSQMGKAGFGSGSFGNSGVATQTADALANAENTLRYNAFNDWQNRAMQGAVAGGNYGLNNQQQQANLIGTGATMQSQAPWQNLFNFKTSISGAPGSTSETQPLFSNPWASAIGGASMGSQVGGGTDWGKVFGNVGSAAGTIGDWFGKLFGGGSGSSGTSLLGNTNTPPVQNDYWNSSNLYPWLKG